MTGSRPAEILRQLETPTATDRELIERFARTRDELAFAELVRRLGPIVLGVCKRVMGHEQDAEDAFQAVFLILARKAGAIGKPELLGNWLHGVAVRVAKTLRRSVHRRRAHEVTPTVMPEPMARPESNLAEMSAFLDEELAALPSWYREAIVLCDLQGIAREEAATRLGVPEGTLSSRLANGRKKLAERLMKRGIALSMAAVPATLSQAQAINVSTELIAKTCSLVADWVSGGTIPKPLAKLTGGGMTMWKVCAAVLLIATLAVAGVVSAFHTPESPRPDKQQPVLAVKPVAAEQAIPNDKPDENQPGFTSTPKLRDTWDLKIDTNSTVRSRWWIDTNSAVGLHWNSRGDRIAIIGNDSIIDPRNLGNDRPKIVDCPMLFVVSISPPGAIRIANVSAMPLVELDKELYQAFAGFTPDGKQVLTEHREYSLFSGEQKLTFWEADGRPAKKDTKIPHLQYVKSLDLSSTETRSYFASADGKSYRTMGIERDPKTETVSRIAVMEIDAATGQRIKTLMTTEAGLLSKPVFKRGRYVGRNPSSAEPALFAMSPDWKRLAVLGNENTVVMFDVDRAARIFSYKVPGEVKKNEVAVREVDAVHETHQRIENDYYRPFVTFSPDGHRLLVSCGPTAYRTYIASGSRVIEILSEGHGQCVVLNADNGEPLPALEGAESLLCIPEANVFSADGRLLALSGISLGISRQKLNYSSNPKPSAEHVLVDREESFLTIWDTRTGKIVKTWDRNLHIAFNPTRLLLAVVESNSDQLARLGLWDFSEEMAEKK